MIYPKVELKNTELHTIKSKINSQGYDIYVLLPGSYKDRTEGETYETLYILNAQWDFGLMMSIIGNCRYDKLIPDMILIGIGWTGQEADEEVQKLSRRDFSAFVEDGHLRGGASSFVAVIEKEIIPYVENNFATNGNRCLFGSSIAAWFGLFAAFYTPNLFTKFILSSPVTAYANGLIFYFESLFSKGATDLDAFIYISYGELEPTQPIKDFIKVIGSRGYKGLRIIDEEISGVGHAGNKPIGYIKGLLKAYNKQIMHD